MADLTLSERDSLLERARHTDRLLYPDDGSPDPSDEEAVRLRETYYQVLGEYGDRLPRVVMNACPFSGQPLVRSFDPWGVDGPWWYQDLDFEIDEPRAPDTFKVLLGAFSLKGRVPKEARDQVEPGPEVPFVVPRLLELPGMIAVASRLELVTGDLAYPIAYFSPEDIPPIDLHQFWLRQDFWFKQEDGSSGWSIANDVWDFDLAPWVETGQLRWIEPGDPDGEVVDVTSGKPCPFLDLPGDRFPQVLAWEEREFLDLPDGTAVNPYED